jgi:membrane peptidoglycan carboxypeptidase
MADPFWELPEEQPSKGSGKAKAPVSRRRKWTLRILKTVAAVALLGLVSVIAFVGIGYTSTEQPNPNKDFQTATTFVYYNDGKSELGTFQVQNRQPLTYDEIPETIKQAVVAAENRSFWTDKGISIRGMFRAAWVIARGGNLQGGSTITQQYIKILYLKQDQTFTRKFKELFLAAKINKQMSKEEILTGYLNTIYYGRDAYGIQAASRAYFDIDAKDLTVPQAAVLASVVNNPSIFDPGEDDSNAARLLGRYRYVLQSMSETGAITAAQAASYGQKLPLFPRIKASQRYGGPKGFLLKMVQRELEADGLDANQINGGGLKITTTFDKKSQKAAVDAAQTYTKRSAGAAGQKASKLHAAIASVEVGTGEVLALYGGPDYVENSRNWATTPRPTASTFKAYALAAGLKDGYSLLSRFNGNTFTPPGDSTPIRNEYSHQYGRVNLIRATADSINTAFVDMVTSMKDGADKVIEMAEAAGAPKGAGWDATARNLPLGTPEVSPLDQAGAFATFGNEGKQVANHVVREVRDANGKVTFKANPEEKRAMSSDVAADVTFALSSVVEEGTGRSVQTLNRPVAGKTGTKDRGNDITSAWFVAYTKQISTAVMYVAGDSGSEDLDKYRRPGDSTFFGGTYPALTWENYMETATEGMKSKDFDPPAYVNKDAADAAEPTQPAHSAEPTPSESPSTAKPSSSATSVPTRSATSRPTKSQRPTKGPSTKIPSGPPSSSASKSAARGAVGTPGSGTG